MKQMEDFRFTKAKGSHYSKYRWDDLLNGEIWKVPVPDINPRENEDPRKTLKRFRRTAHAAATVRDLKLQTQIVDDTYIVIQARPLR